MYLNAVGNEEEEDGKQIIWSACGEVTEPEARGIDATPAAEREAKDEGSPAEALGSTRGFSVEAGWLRGCGATAGGVEEAIVAVSVGVLGKQGSRTSTSVNAALG